MNAPLQILLIEDNPDHAFLARRELKKCGLPFEVHHAADSSEALDWLRERLPDLILLDIKLPGRDGFELLILLKADERTRDIPVVLLTSSPAPADIERATRLGAASYFTKPLQAESIKSILQNLVV